MGKNHRNMRIQEIMVKEAVTAGFSHWWTCFAPGTGSRMNTGLSIPISLAIFDAPLNVMARMTGSLSVILRNTRALLGIGMNLNMCDIFISKYMLEIGGLQPLKLIALEWR